MTTATIVTSRPILFSGPMVQSLLSGRKTQTRRIIDYPPFHPTDEGIYQEWILGNIKSKYGLPGHDLWVKETHYRFTGLNLKSWEGYVQSPDGNQFQGRFYADNPAIQDLIDCASVVKVPSLFMPQWASRITLAVKNVRVERLQDITKEDAIAEGIEVLPDYGNNTYFYSIEAKEGHLQFATAVEAYAALWDSINGKKEGASWSDNPWVWVVEFEVSK